MDDYDHAGLTRVKCLLTRCFMSEQCLLDLFKDECGIQYGPSPHPSPVSTETIAKWILDAGKRLAAGLPSRFQQYREEFEVEFHEKSYRPEVRSEWEHLPFDEQRAYLWVVGVHLRSDFLRKLRRREGLEDSLEQRRENLSEQQQSDWRKEANSEEWFSETVSVEDAAITSITLKKIFQGVRKEDWPVFRLMIEKTPAKEAAKILRISEANYRKKCQLLRERIKKCEKEESDDNGPSFEEPKTRGEEEPPHTHRKDVCPGF